MHLKSTHASNNSRKQCAATDTPGGWQSKVTEKFAPFNHIKTNNLGTNAAACPKEIYEKKPNTPN